MGSGVKKYKWEDEFKKGWGWGLKWPPYEKGAQEAQDKGREVEDQRVHSKLILCACANIFHIVVFTLNIIYQGNQRQTSAFSREN